MWLCALSEGWTRQWLDFIGPNGYNARQLVTCPLQASYALGFERDPAMPDVICFANMKGGVGKTTLCVNLAYELFAQGKRVLVVDNDPQFNATSALISPERYLADCIKSRKQLTIYDIYEKPPRVGRRARKTPDPTRFFMRTWHQVSHPTIALDVIPSRIELYETLENPFKKDYLLHQFLAKHAQHYDYILIDCPPTPSVLTVSAFAASDFVIIPISPGYYATIGLPQFLGRLKDFKSGLDPHDIRTLGVVFTNVPRRSTPDADKAMLRVRRALATHSPPIPIFTSKTTHLTVYEKTLWQSVPVQKITGRGTRGKSLATAELSAIANEIRTTIPRLIGT